MKQIKQNQKGYTLIELIVTFALLGMLMATAIAILMYFMKLHFQQTSIAHAQTVSDILLTKISSQLSEAESFPEGTIFEEDELIQFLNDKNEIVTIGTFQSFENKNELIDDDTKALLDNGTLVKNLLNIDYATVETDSTGKPTGSETRTDWYYGIDLYRNNEISSLHFKYIKDKKVVKVTITLKNIKTGYEYESEKIIKCINLKD